MDRNQAFRGGTGGGFVGVGGVVREKEYHCPKGTNANLRFLQKFCEDLRLSMERKKR